MWPWQKKKQPETPTPPKECNHKFKDFPWYIDAVFWNDIKKCQIKVIEPYVCVICKTRKNITLQETIRTNSTWDKTVQLKNKFSKEYEKYCQPRAVVEDMINDMQLIDKDFLKYYEAIHGNNKEIPKIEETISCKS